MRNRECGERAADLRRILMTLEFLGERPVRIVADEDPVLVGVHRRRQPHRLTEGAQEGEVASRVLLDPKASRQDGPRGVINGPEEGARGWVRAKPRVGAPIELAQQPGLGPPGAATPVQGRAAAARGPDPGGPQDSADRRAADGQPLDGGELLRE